MARTRPILFSAPMVRAILAGSKTQTRRPVKGTAAEWLYEQTFDPEFVAAEENHLCPYGQPGDQLWVRETWMLDGSTREYVYRADPAAERLLVHWRPSIHMPRAASRLMLVVTGVRIERLHAISEADASAEGVDSRESYRTLWDEINGAGAWDANPWVWVVEFKRAATLPVQWHATA